MSTTDVARTWANVDDVLGPASGRFFGSIFRDARQSLDVVLTTARPDRVEIAGRAGVSYHGDHWGTRNGKVRAPHLSSVDATILTDRVLAEVGRSLRDAGLLTGRLVMDRVSITAGMAPDEELAELVCAGSATVLLGEPTRVRCTLQIGGMRVRAEAAAVAGEPAPELTAADVPALTVADVVLDPETPTVSGRVVTDLDAGEPSASALIVSMLASAQLAQILVATVDGIPRERSNTLWMRRFDCRWTPETAPGEHVVVGIGRHERIAMGGREYSVVEGSATGLSAHTAYSITHDTNVPS